MKEFIDKLIGRLEEAKFLHTQFDGVMPEEVEVVSIGGIKNIVNQLAEEYNQENDDTDYANIELYAFWQKHQWITCSERLPEVEADVLLSLRSLDIYTGFRANTEGCFYVEGEGYVEFENVLAWKPLPAPFKPKGE